MKTLYKAQMTVEGGRDGQAISDDGEFELNLSLPKALGGAGGRGTNPEQLFAAGYAACFDSALRFVAGQRKIKINSSSVTAKVAIGPRAEGGFQLAVDLNITLPELASDEAHALVDAAHLVCPYSHATRGNIDVTLHTKGRE